MAVLGSMTITGHLSTSLPHGKGTFFPRRVLVLQLTMWQVWSKLLMYEISFTPPMSYLNFTRQYLTTENLLL